MSYSHGAYGYAPYFEGREHQNHHQEHHHNQLSELGQSSTPQFSSQAGPYGPYYATAPVNVIQNTSSQQDYSQRSNNQTPNYSGYPPPSSQDSRSSYPPRSAAQSPAQLLTQRYQPPTSNVRQNDGSRIGSSYNQEPHSYEDTSGLGSLAYASSLSQSVPTYQANDYQQTGAQGTVNREVGHPHGYPQDSGRGSQSQPSARDSRSEMTSREEGKQLANPSQYRVNYSPHTVTQAAQHYPSPQDMSRSTNPTGGQQIIQANKAPSPPTRNSQKSPAGARKASKREKTPSSKQRRSSPPQILTPYYHPQESAVRSPLINMTNVPEETDSRPLTVDPSQIFDQAEYQRRKAAAEAEAEAERKRARVKETFQLEQAANSMINGSTAPLVSDASSQPRHGRTDSNSRETIEAEMRVMIEKMRKYKAQDPTVFSEVWEQFRKEGAQPARASSQTPKIAQASLPKTDPPATNPPDLAKGNLESPIPHNSSKPRPSAAVATESPTTVPPLDRGKFPLMRRKRRRSEKAASKVAEASTSLAGQPNPATPHILPPPPVYVNHMTPVTQPEIQLTQEVLGSTVWPSPKRRRIAEVAKRTLELHPANLGKVIPVSDLESMFLQQPSYDQFCRILTEKGFTLNKGVLAQVLLASINSSDGELEGYAPGQPFKQSELALDPNLRNMSPPQPNSSIERKRKFQYEDEDPGTSKKLRATNNPPLSSLSDKMQNLFKADNLKTNQKPNSWETPLDGVNNDPKPVDEPSKPLTKEQMARKTDFKDLVDLTRRADDDSDEGEPLENSFSNPKMPQFLGQSYGHSEERSQQMSVGLDKLSHMQGTLDTPGQSQAHRQSAGSANQKAQSQRSKSFAQTGGYRHESLRNEQVVKPIDYSKPLRKTKFNPTTIARDILIARGEHPTMNELNWHLASLRDNFRHVNFRSDLSTIRWDLIDPGEPDIEIPIEEPDENDPEIVKPLTHQQTEESQLRYRSPSPVEAVPSPLVLNTDERRRGRPRGRPRIRGTSGVTHADLASKREAFQAQASTREDVLVSKTQGGRVKSQGALAVVSLQTSPSFTPVGPSTQNPDTMPRITSHSRGASINSGDKSDEEGETSQKGLNRNEALLVRSDLPGHSSGAFIPIVHGTPKISGKGPGRPPKSTVSSLLEPREASRERPLSGQLPGVKKRGRPKGSKNSPFAKKPGRPSKPKSANATGIRTEMPEDGVGVMLPSRSPSVSAPLSYIEIPPTPESKPKRWKARPTYPFETPDPDAFISFPCRWVGCAADLHNLETLRKHVFKMHPVLPSGEAICHWESCGQKFANSSDWRAHIQDTHLKGVAKKFGDGPSTHPTVVDPFTYLSDGKGNTVTPLAKIHGMPDPLPLHAGKGPTRAYHKAHGNITPEQKARAEERSRRWHEKVAAEGLISPYRTNAPTITVDTDVDAYGTALDDSGEDTDDSMSGVEGGRGTVVQIPFHRSRDEGSDGDIDDTDDDSLESDENGPDPLG